MIDGNAKEFISKLSYEDHYAVYNGKKYFFNGCRKYLILLWFAQIRYCRSDH